MKNIGAVTALVIFGSVGGASAGSFIATAGVAEPGQGLVSGRGGVTEERFEGFDCTLTTSAQVLGTRGTDYAVANDNVLNRRLAPANDTSCYFSVGAAVQSSNIVIDLPDGAPVRYVGFYWGSVDAYNSVSFLNEQGAFATISGYGDAVDGTAAAERAGVSLGDSIFAEFRFFAGENITAIFLETTNWAFEIDNLAFSTVFVPASPSSLSSLSADLVNGAVVDRLTTTPLTAGPFQVPAPLAWTLLAPAVLPLARRARRRG